MKPTIDKTDTDFARKNCPVGSVLIIVFRRVSPSGLARWYDVYTASTYPDKTSYPLMRWTLTVAGMIDHSYDRKREAIRVNGCGFSAPDEICRAFGIALHNNVDAFAHQDI